jgi:hypothetical protein
VKDNAYYKGVIVAGDHLDNSLRVKMGEDIFDDGVVLGGVVFLTLSDTPARPEAPKDARELWGRLLYKLNANIEPGPKLNSEAITMIDQFWQDRHKEAT